jgi:isoprenylcysteine carboxyl methyltransferase (ICMT) family protein YpbQ
MFQALQCCVVSFVVKETLQQLIPEHVNEAVVIEALVKSVAEILTAVIETLVMSDALSVVIEDETIVRKLLFIFVMYPDVSVNVLNEAELALR